MFEAALAHPWHWSLFLVYLVVTAALAWQGGRKDQEGGGFAVGSGRMSPWMAGLTLGACLASSSTFVIMPGFVYADGLPALLGFTVPLVAGLALGLVLFAPPFQRIGKRVAALTIPHWLGERYGSAALRKAFAGLNVLNVAYLVLITVGCGYVMERALGVPYEAAVVGIVLFVFGYTAFGGAWAHALTNSMQASVMLVVALAIFGAGWQHWQSGAVVETLVASGTTAPDSALFSSALEVWLVPFLMGLALTTQPHLLTKALYVEGRGALGRTVAIGMGTFVVFSLVLFAGVYARFDLAQAVPQDQAMGAWLAVAFPWEPVGALVSVAILAASMSTLDGLLVAISASVGGDLLGTGQAGTRRGVWLNRAVLGVLALLTIGVALSPPKLVLLLGQLGVYGLVAASAGPLVGGLFRRGPLSPRWALLSAGLALVVHFGLGLTVVANPGVSAAIALAVGVPIGLLAPAPATRTSSSVLASTAASTAAQSATSQSSRPVTG
ncbi:MAG: hypothetical protein H6742_00580 [Alphaproteobacteria bacterium]|nr:hypothetical protein [Alphaproteobacteria bacterium]